MQTKNIMSETIAHTFIQSRVPYFRVPSRVTSDRGAQFMSCLFRDLQRLLGCDLVQTTVYHAASNGLVERLHRQLNSASMTNAQTENWLEALPMTLLGLRSMAKEDLGCWR